MLYDLYVRVLQVSDSQACRILRVSLTLATRASPLAWSVTLPLTARSARLLAAPSTTATALAGVRGRSTIASLLVYGDRLTILRVWRRHAATHYFSMRQLVRQSVG